MPRLLLVTYCFPPDYSVGAKRALRMAQHLAGLGWDVEVLSVRESYCERLDMSLVTGAPAYRVFRTHALLPKDWARRARSALARMFRAHQGSAQAGDQTAPWRRKGRLSRAWDCTCSIPDEWNGWLPPACLHGALHAKRPDIVLASGPPFTGLVVGAVLAKLWSTSLVLDYRDPWTTLGDHGGFPEWRSRLVRRLERWCVRRAAAVVTTTCAIAESLKVLWPARVEVIPNAYDPSLMSGIPATRYERFTIVYTGNFAGNRSPMPVLSAISRLSASGSLPEGGLALRVIGSSGSQVASAAGALGVAAFVEIEDFVPHREALARMRGADVLLLVVGAGHAGMVPAKLFEYLAARRFILALAPEGSEAGRILEEVAAGTVVPIDDDEAIARVLSTRFGAGRADLPGHPGLDSYESSVTMRNLDRLLRGLLSAADR